jgi:hypothetical protein
LYVMGSGSAGNAAIAVQMRPPPFVTGKTPSVKS